MTSPVWSVGAGEPPSAAEIGGKAAALARLSALAATPGAEFTVPRWLVIGAAVFERALREARSSDALAPPAESWESEGGAIAQRAEEGEASRLRRGLLRTEPPSGVREAVREAIERLGLGGRRLAVRSSAVGEDGALASFAGQFDSILGVPGDDAAIWDAVRRVWASALNPHAVAYREQRAADAAAGTRMAVVIQEMVAPEAAGVAFSADPVSGDRDTAVVSAVPGLGEGLVSGELDADTFRVRLDGVARVTERRIVPKERSIRMSERGTESVVTEAAQRETPALSDREAEAIARCVKRLEAAFGAPQDVEWAIERGPMPRLLVLQARPITTLGAATAPGILPPFARPSGTWPSDPVAGDRSTAPPRIAAAASPSSPTSRGERRIWDNSNIVESYAGVTTPLTFSFARAVYEDVYRQFCRALGVPESRIHDSRRVFENMLGLQRGRVYYNLLNWYRLLALLPGFSFNRGFMERMMGVREHLEDPPPPPSTGQRLLDLAQLVRGWTSIAVEALRLGHEVPAFHARVESRLAPLAERDLTAMPPGEIVALYRRLEDELLHHWRAPLVNDFFAMIFFGTLCRLIETWLPGSPPTLANDLLCGEGGIISTEPARAVMGLARKVAGNAALSSAFAELPDDGALWRRLHEEPRVSAFAHELDAYVRRFGDRTMNELKLETLTLRDDPGFLLQMIRNYAREGTLDPEAARERERTIRRDAEAAVRGKLTGTRRIVFAWVTAQARARVRDRENLRFERTRVFGLVRRMFLGLGAHLAAAGRLDDARDVFYLTVEEVFADAEGTGVSADLRALVRERRAEFERWASEPSPPERFETYGTPAEWTPPAAGAAAGAGAPAGGVSELRGLGCCPGVVRAPVRVVHDPAQARDLAGHILVAERTDPGWTLLFPAARGLLVQRGSLLSHSAIVAREMALPCVVGIAGLLDALRDGETVEMDGTTGLVRRIEGAS